MLQNYYKEIKNEQGNFSTEVNNSTNQTNETNGI